ncbi:MAG: DNA polymerase III subunit gamma/tau [Bdellovibrionales bacterium]|nr:DNA polymerase III subunit gamma/tau [Bdellovibrionales bacterium]
MSYLVLARKFRPLDFSAIAGQEHVTRALRNAIERGKVPHAFIFSGPRGVGKTSVARVLSKALNCENGPTADPCGVCSNCQDIVAGRSIAVREIDGASHNSVENVRELIETLKSLPAPGSRYKVYIIDEVHMLSTAAFNALLKSLEEPPPNTVFILATTEVHKIPNTVLSRCQRYEFRALSTDIIDEKLREVARIEEINAEPEVLALVARLADGSMRDAQSLLDRIQSFSDGRLTLAEASAALGIVERRQLLLISGAVLKRDCKAVLGLVADVFSAGIDPRLFLDEFVRHFRDLLIAKFGKAESLEEIGVPEDIRTELKRQVETISETVLQDLVFIAREGADAAIRSAYPKYSLESLLVRMATREPVEDLGKLISGAMGSKSHNKSFAPLAKKAGTLPRSSKSLSVAKQGSGSIPENKTSIAKPENKSGMLSWQDFVRQVSQSQAKMLCEYLKRLKIEEFSAGVLRASGPVFAVRYLKDKEAEFVSFLQSFQQCDTWVVEVSEVNSTGAAEGSLLALEKQEKQNAQEQRVRSAEDNPALETLRQFFPGSTLKKPQIANE